MTVSKQDLAKIRRAQHCCVLLVISHQSLDLNCRHSLSYLEMHLRWLHLRFPY